jgi:hypothetical protein
LHRQTLALGVSHKLAGLLLVVFGRAGGLIFRSSREKAQLVDPRISIIQKLYCTLPAFLWTLSVANFDERLVAFFDGFRHGLLLERDLAVLLEVLLAHLLLGGLELSDVRL